MGSMYVGLHILICLSVMMMTSNYKFGTEKLLGGWTGGGGTGIRGREAGVEGVGSGGRGGGKRGERGGGSFFYKSLKGVRHVLKS